MTATQALPDHPVRALQTMLRTIAAVEPAQVNVIPDGIYGPQTAEAVRSFQRRQGLTPTGQNDPATEAQIREAYQRSYLETTPAQPLRITLDPGQILRRGERNGRVYLVQSLLTVLHLLYPQIPAPGHTGVLDGPTGTAIAAFQTAAGLPPTGEVDKRTWKQLALFYTLALDRLEAAADL